MAVNKVVYGNNTLIDLTSDTVDASKVLSGYTTHDKSGAKITGNIPSQGANTITPTSAGTQTVCSSGKYTTGDQKVDINAFKLGVIASKIIQGQSILGVSGSVPFGAKLNFLGFSTWTSNTSNYFNYLTTSKKIDLVITAYARTNTNERFGFAYFDLVNKKCGRCHYNNTEYKDYMSGYVTHGSSSYTAHDSYGNILYEWNSNKDREIQCAYIIDPDENYNLRHMDFAFGWA